MDMGINGHLRTFHPPLEPKFMQFSNQPSNKIRFALMHWCGINKVRAGFKVYLADQYRFERSILMYSTQHGLNIHSAE